MSSRAREQFIKTYVYKVPKDRFAQYLDIQRRTKEIYLRYGCIAYEVLRTGNGWCLEICRFKDRKHYTNVIKSVDLDPGIKALWKEFCSIVDKEKITTRKYEKIL